jgi:DNA-directed RNA polymerase sigma subunit (sigma70/sigma32)
MAIDDCSLCEPTQVDGITIDSNMEDLLREVLKNMTINERDRFILIGYFNVPGKDRQSDPKNLHQLAALTGITPERVRQIKENVLKQLKKDLKKCAIEGVDSICAMN